MYMYMYMYIYTEKWLGLFIQECSLYHRCRELRVSKIKVYGISFAYACVKSEQGSWYIFWHQFFGTW